MCKQGYPTTADHVQATGEVLSPGALASSRIDARVSDAWSSMSPAELAAAVVPAVPQFFMGPFTASSGERVLLSQRQGQWQVVLQGSAGTMTHRRSLDVVSLGNIEASLKALQGQDAWSSRSRMHVLSASHTLSTPCIYVGKLGLLGVLPRNKRSSSVCGEEQAAEERAKLAEEKPANLEKQVLLSKTTAPAMAFDVLEEWKKLQAVQAQQQREYEAKLVLAEQEKLLSNQHTRSYYQSSREPRSNPIQPQRGHSLPSSSASVAVTDYASLSGIWCKDMGKVL
jgi:hypothetical protein